MPTYYRVNGTTIVWEYDETCSPRPWREIPDVPLEVRDINGRRIVAPYNRHDDNAIRGQSNLRASISFFALLAELGVTSPPLPRRSTRQATLDRQAQLQ